MVEPAPATKYECPENCKILKADNQSYEYVKFLGQGGCGAVLEYRNMATNQRVAAKVDTRQTGNTLFSEEMTLKNLWKKNPEQPLKHLPKFFGSVSFPENYIFIELFPTTLESYLKQDLPNNQGKPSLVKVAVQMMAALKEMHDRDFVHRDVKTENFMVDNHVVKIIDFGLSHNFMKEGNHTTHQAIGGFQGTIPFASVNTLQGFNGFRRDDLESLAYAIMTLIDKEKVPWKPYQNDRAKTLELKQKFAAEENPDPVFHGIQKFIKRVQALKFDEKPDYEALEKDIEIMLFDEKKFNKMFEDALPQFYTRLARQVMKEAKSEACETATRKFLTQAQQARVFYEKTFQIDKKLFRGRFSKWTAFTISAIKVKMANEKQQLQREATVKNLEIQQLTTRATAAESTLATTKTTLATTETTLSSTQQKLQVEEAKSKSLSDEKNRLTQELDGTKTKLQTEEQQHAKTQRELISARGTLETTQKDLISTKNTLESTRQQLDAVSAGLAQTCQELEDIKNKLQAAEKLIKEKDESIINKDTLLKWAKETEDKLNAEIDKLQKEKSGLDTSLQSTQKQLDEKKTECNGLQEALAGEKDYTASLEDQNRQNKKDKERLEGEKKQVQTLLDTERTSFTNLKKSLEDQISSLTSSLTTAKGQFDKTQQDLNAKIAQLTKDLGQERSHAAKLHQDLDTEKGKVTALEFELQQAGISASQQETKLKNAADLEKALNSEIHTLKTKINKAESVCVDLLRHFFHLDSQQLPPDQSIIENLSSRLKVYKKDQEDTVQALGSQFSESQEKSQKLESQLQAQKSAFDKLKSDFEKLQGDMQNERGQADQKFSQMTSSHEATVQSLKTQVENLSSSSKTAVRDLNKQLEDRKNENQAISQKLSSSEASLTQTNEDVKRLKGENSNLLQDISRLKGQYASQTGQIETLKTEKTQLERQLDEKITELATLKETASKKEEADTAKANNELTSLKKEFNQLVQTSRDLEIERETLQKELKFQEDKHKKEIEKATATLNAQIVTLLDEIKELKMDKEFISVSLAQAKTDIEMQTKARADLFKKYQDSMNASTALSASAGTKDTEIDNLKLKIITLDTMSKELEFKVQNITTQKEQIQREFEKAKEELQIARAKIYEHQATPGQPTVQTLQADVNRLQELNLALEGKEKDLNQQLQSANVLTTMLKNENDRLQKENQELKAKNPQPQESDLQQAPTNNGDPSYRSQEEEKTSQVDDFLLKLFQGSLKEEEQVKKYTQRSSQFMSFINEKEEQKSRAEQSELKYKVLEKKYEALKEKEKYESSQKSQDQHVQAQTRVQSQPEIKPQGFEEVDLQLSISTIKRIFRQNLIDPQAPAVYIESAAFPAKVELRNDTLDQRSDDELRAAFNEALLQSKEFRKSLIEVANKTESNQYTITIDSSQIEKEQPISNSTMEEEKGEIETAWRSPSQKALYTKTQNDEENMSNLFNQLYQSRKERQPFAVQVKVQMKQKSKGQKLTPELEQLERQEAIQFFAGQVKGLQSQMDQQKNGTLKTFRFTTGTAHWKELVKAKKVMGIFNGAVPQHWVQIELRNKNMPQQRHYFQMSEEVNQNGATIAWQVQNVKLTAGTYYYQYIVVKENKGSLEAQYFQDYQGANQVGIVEVKGPEDQVSPAMNQASTSKIQQSGSGKVTQK